MQKTITMLPPDIKKGKYTWEPKTMEEAKAIVKHLQNAIENKDKRIIALSKLERASRQECELLYDRITHLRQFLTEIGLKII